MKEAEILEVFIGKNVLKGVYFKEVPVGIEIKGRESSEVRRIDAICVTSPLDEDEKSWTIARHFAVRPRRNSWLNFAREHLKGKSVWILEVKRKLNAEVIGQAITDKELFPLDNPKVRIEGLGVIVEESDELLAKVCHNLDIHIFQL